MLGAMAGLEGAVGRWALVSQDWVSMVAELEIRLDVAVYSALTTASRKELA